MEISSWLDELRLWCAGRRWITRLPILVWMVYLLVRHLADPEYQGLIKPLNLGIHELGHFVFMPFGEFISVLGGSLFQLLVPIISIFMFWRQADFFAVSFALGWLGTNFFDVATYLGDARDMLLPLVSPFGGEGTIHDWNYLLARLNLLEHCRGIAQAVRFIGGFFLLAGIIGAGWLLWWMFRQRRSEPVEGGFQDM